MAGYIGSKASVVSSGAERKKTFAITTSTTSLTGLSYTVDQVHVFHNGVRLVDGTDYTATNGTSITLTSAAESGDEVVVVSYATFQTSDTVSASAGGTFSAPVTIDASSATALTVDRATTDGTIIDVQRGGTTVGSIESYAGVVTGMTLYPAGNVGIRGATSEIVPYANGADRDNSISLGIGNKRFKDLYLSGGVYLGGTGSANKLDDYEAGSHVTSLISGGGSVTLDGAADQLFYVKVGDLVFLSGRLKVSAISSPTGSLQLSLPFTAANNTSGTTDGVVPASVISFNANTLNGNEIGLNTQPNNLTAIFRNISISAPSTSSMANEMAVNTLLYISMTYRAA